MNQRPFEPKILQEPSPAVFIQAGTGGWITSETFDRLYVSIKEVKRNFETSHTTTTIDSRSPHEQLNGIRDVFGLNISELANILGITRPTVYSWLQGQNLKPEALSKIARLASVGTHIKILNIKRIDTFLHRPIFNGHSLYDKLKNDDEDLIESLKVLQDISNREDLARQTAKGSQKNESSTEPRGHSTPFYRE